MLKATLLKAAGSPTLKRQMTANPVARRVAGRFIAGATIGDAERVIRELNAKGMSVALDHLGENTGSQAQAREAAAAYLAALDRIQEHGLDANISVKLTALGLDIRPELALEEASKVAARGKEVGAMVGVDMESHAYVERTLETVRRLSASYDDVGVCVQAYLYRTRDDLDRLNDLGVPVRLVKGAYREPPEVAYPHKASVDGAYARLLDSLIQANPYPMVATHDPALVRLAKTLVARYARDRDTFEFQMLYGVRRDLQEQVLAEGYRLRVYVPYGDQWYPYFMRRLAERPANLYFFLSNLAKR
ncbi:MAG TPA: proline dehydrogenase family protein [Actinomycetota bacterium]|nr:proline dehydrogenase family protein [Actinomycetota bacterium]